MYNKKTQKDQWVKWTSSNIDLAGNFYIYEVVYNFKDLKLVLADWDEQDRRLEVTFLHSYLYRITNESLCVKLEQYLKENYGTVFYQRWSFFVVNNSSYINEMGYLNSDKKLIHFVVMGSESVVDILSEQAPMVTISI